MNLRIAVVLAALVALSGCSKPGLVGKWHASRTSGSATVDITLVFNKDGKFEQSSAVSGGHMAATLLAKGTYKESGKDLTMTVTSAEMNGMPQALQGEKTQTVPYTLSGDKLTLNGLQGANSLQLDRVK